MRARLIYRAWKARLRDQRLEVAVTRALATPGAFVVDAGANKGAYLYWLRRAVGENGRVIAVEPQPRLAAYLRAIRERFDWHNVDIAELALSDRAGTSVLHVPGSDVSPSASLEATALAQGDGTTYECRIETLDTLLDGQPPLRFLKVDVEGHELALFRGGEQRLRRDMPAILFECEVRHLTRHRMSDVFGFLEDLGYEGYLLHSQSLLPVAQFDVAIHQRNMGPRFWNAPDYYNNFLFLKRGQRPPPV